MKRRWTIIGLVAAIVVASLVFYLAHNHGGNQNQQITVFGEDSSNLKAYALLRDEYLQKTGIDAKFEGTTFEQAVQKADADFRAGQGTYDIVLQYNFSLAPYVRNHYVLEIGSNSNGLGDRAAEINSRLFQNALKETCFYYSNPQDPTSSPKQFGFPFAANTMLLAYNRDLFEDPELKQKYKDRFGKELAVPADWDTYLDVADFFSNSRPGLKGVCVQGANDGWLYYELCNYLFSMGAGTSAKTYGWEETKNLTISDSRNVRVLEYYKRLTTFSSGDFYTVGAAQQQEILLKGKTAMGIVWSDYVQPLAASQSPRFGFAPIPGKISGLAGGAFYINAKSKNIHGATQFVTLALSLESQSRLVEKGLCSPVRQAYSPAVFNKVPYAKALYESLDRGVYMFEASTDAETITSALTTSVQKFVRGEMSAAEALQQAQSEVLAKKGK